MDLLAKSDDEDPSKDAFPSDVTEQGESMTIASKIDPVMARFCVQGQVGTYRITLTR